MASRISKAVAAATNLAASIYLVGDTGSPPPAEGGLCLLRLACHMGGKGISEGQAQAIAATLRASPAFTIAAAVAAVAAAPLACLKRTHASICTTACKLY